MARLSTGVCLRGTSAALSITTMVGTCLRNYSLPLFVLELLCQKRSRQLEPLPINKHAMLHMLHLPPAVQCLDDYAVDFTLHPFLSGRKSYHTRNLSRTKRVAHIRLMSNDGRRLKRTRTKKPVTTVYDCWCCRVGTSKHHNTH